MTSQSNQSIRNQSSLGPFTGKLREHIISISADNFHILHGAEVEEVRGPMDFMVELFGVGQLQLVTHVRRVTNTHKIEVQDP